MSLKEKRIKSAFLCNSLNSKGYNLANQRCVLDRLDFINNYTQEVIDACWESLSINIIQNYQRGKGTYIKGFGTFTYKAPEVNLEGTTNQNKRDKKPQKPIFIVSKEFNENFHAGEYTRQNGIRYFTQKESKDISIVKLNLAEIGYSLSMSKEEVANLLKHLIFHLNQSIINKTFNNKVLPGLGVLVNRNNIIAVKFNESFVDENLTKNRKLAFTKRNILLNLDMNSAENIISNECPNPFRNIEELKATNSLKTVLEKSGKEYLKDNYGIDVHKVPEHDIKVINNNFNNYENNSFVNDYKKRPKSHIGRRILPKNGEDSDININKDTLNNLDEETLRTLEYYKGNLIKNCKNYDISKNGTISKEEAIKAMVQTNINNKIDYNMAKTIVEGYNKTEDIEYMKFIALMVKNSRLILLKKNHDKNISYNTLKTENIFTPTKQQKLSRFFSSKNLKNNNRNKNSININSTKKSNDNSLSNINEEEEKNSFRNIITYQNIKSSSNLKNILSKSQNNFLINRQKETEESRQRLATIVTLLPELKRKYFISLDQKMSYEEFIIILKKYDINYTPDLVISLLKFLNINDINAFSLREFESHVDSCKIIISKITLKKLNEVMKKIKDVIFINGGSKFLFNNNINQKNTIESDMFIKLLVDKIPYDSETLKNVFHYLVKTDREFNMDDYIQYFDNPEVKIEYDENYFLNMMKKIFDLMNKKQFNADEFFDHLLLNNVSTLDKVITPLNWIKYIQKEKLDFSAEELDNLFKWIDTKKDNVIDREEFINKFRHTFKPLTQVQCIIYDDKLDIEDLAHHMDISMSELEKYDFETFKEKMKKLNYTYSDEFIKSIFNKIKKIYKDKDKKKNDINSKQFLDEINYVKPASLYNSFIQNYMNTVRSKTNHDDFKSLCELFDNDCLGTLSKTEYVKVVGTFLPEFKDDDHMKFLRITNMFDKYGDVKYPDVLKLIFFYHKEKLDDNFVKLCLTLSNLLINECKNDVESLMNLIETGSTKNLNKIKVRKPLNFEQIKTFLNKKDLNIPDYIINKLDIDADGMISFEDLTSVLKRFSYTSFFKYKNESTDPNIYLFSDEKMSKEKFNSIVKRIKLYMKSKNLTEIGLFQKFDKDKDGLISCVDFNSNMDEIISISPALKDQFFNYLDFYHNGLVDLETFISRLNNVSVIHNNNKIENEILHEMKEFVLKNKNFSDNEIFEVMDKDCDGLISLDDLKLFIVNNLDIPESRFNKAKLERVIMSLSLSKNCQIGLNDIREFINICNQNKDFMNLKEVFTITSNQNFSEIKTNRDWTNDIIERLGMFISEKYDSIEEFFNENTEKGSDVFKLEDFLKFHEKNCELFNNGFNLTRDELLSIYTSLDSQKKDYLTLQDLKNKLQIFNFYNKMHIDVKNFLRDNFNNGVDAFKFFIRKKSILDDDKDYSKTFITVKEFFDTFENFFPNKYPTNTILKYINKYFKISLPNNKNNLPTKKDTINFEEFNYIYFDSVQNKESYLYNRINDTKLLTNREEIKKKSKNDLIHSPQNNFYFSSLFKKKYEKLITPFDKDPLDKIKRILCSSKYDLNKFFETVKKLCGNDKYIVNKYQLRNIIKELNIGLTNVEIDQIIFKCGKESHDGNINLNEFIKYLYNQNRLIEEGKNNVGPIMGEIKSLIYKYYNNPIICFENNDTLHCGKMDFDKYKNIIYDMYNREEKKLPNFTLIKNSFDAIDLRKDGIIDKNEWCKAFASYNGKLDFKKESVTNGLEFYDKESKNSSTISHNRKILRDWETSGDVSYLFKFIYKNRKVIKEKIKKCNYVLTGDGVQMIHADNLISILKDALPGMKLSQTQWKIIVSPVQKERIDGLINVNEFFKLLETSSKNMAKHPIIKRKIKMNNLIYEYSGFNCNNVGFKTMYNGYYHNKRTNSINKDPKNFRVLSSKYGNPYSYALTCSNRGKSTGINKRFTTLA